MGPQLTFTHLVIGHWLWQPQMGPNIVLVSESSHDAGGAVSKIGGYEKHLPVQFPSDSTYTLLSPSPWAAFIYVPFLTGGGLWRIRWLRNHRTRAALVSSSRTTTPSDPSSTPLRRTSVTSPTSFEISLPLSRRTAPCPIGILGASGPPSPQPTAPPSAAFSPAPVSSCRARSPGRR